MMPGPRTLRKTQLQALEDRVATAGREEKNWTNGSRQAPAKTRRHVFVVGKEFFLGRGEVAALRVAGWDVKVLRRADRIRRAGSNLGEKAAAVEAAGLELNSGIIGPQNTVS